MMDNYQRMMKLVTEFYYSHDEETQITVDDKERRQLEAIGPDCLSEISNEHGPILWLMLIPTTEALMQEFLSGGISEKQLLLQTRPGEAYDALYLCSCFVLPEFRRQGLAGKKAIEVIDGMRQRYAFKALFYWPFSEEGKGLSNRLAAHYGLPLYEKREEQQQGS